MTKKRQINTETDSQKLEAFIKQELRNRKRDYSESPAYILEHYHIEQQNIQAYNGRQLLEMLQNADDASENTLNSQTLIKLDGKELIIANNGEPFTVGGFRSVIYSNLSPKTVQQNKIGQKGLGFRSPLSWADKITIKSGNANIEFSEEYAKLFLKELVEQHPHTDEFLKANSSIALPIATLRIPRILEKNEELPERYDTVITLQLKENVLSDVRFQISEIINKETLLFLNHLKVIEIDSPATKIIFTKKLMTITL